MGGEADDPQIREPGQPDGHLGAGGRRNHGAGGRHTRPTDFPAEHLGERRGIQADQRERRHLFPAAGGEQAHHAQPGTALRDV